MNIRWGERTYVMGILNATPDSFSGDGLLDETRDWRLSSLQSPVERAVAQATQFVADGADILDLGGESTPPGSTPVSAAEELARVIPLIRAVRQAVDVLISVDTYRAAVAEAALEAGADWINDVWGLRMDPDMAPLVASSGCPIVIMHNRSRPKDAVQAQRLGGYYQGVQYDNLIADICRELQESIELARAAGIKPEQIIIDPGIGFGKTPEQNLELLDGLIALKSLGYPILLGTSRKSFIGRVLDAPPEDRLEGTAATVAIGIARGADIVRVHDVKAMVRVARMTDEIVRRKERGRMRD
jgi:dihydropteroate synthase